VPEHPARLDIGGGAFKSARTARCCHSAKLSFNALLRWRNNPTNAPPITRSRYELALICSEAA
jgi:hypothetical protein